MIGKDKMKRYRPFRFLFLKEKTFSVANLYKKYRNGLAVYGKNFIGSLPLCFFNWTKDARNGGDRPPYVWCIKMNSLRFLDKVYQQE